MNPGSKTEDWDPRPEQSEDGFAFTTLDDNRVIVRRLERW